ncbi:general transcription factor II-I repeat domain-containing protein 2B-like [Ornithodoros turicata]|uniref:general transcription factor II-I repeat domain-containing protein 2B-like n=1 Tax=Ornithodoros turicata TaxID=34597 RepID=UPI003139E82F
MASRGKVLQRVFNLRDEIKEFLHNKGKECTEMADPEHNHPHTYHHITNHLSILNMGLQGKARLITEMYDSVKGFVRNLKAVDCKNEETLRTYSSTVSELRREFMSRFHDFAILEAMFKLFADPFSVLPEDVKPELQMKLIDLQCNSTLRQKFDEIGVSELYKYVDRKSFPCLMPDVSHVLSMFGSTYVCEQFFSIMNINKTKLRSQLSDGPVESSSSVENCHCGQPTSGPREPGEEEEASSVVT